MAESAEIVKATPIAPVPNVGVVYKRIGDLRNAVGLACNPCNKHFRIVEQHKDSWKAVCLTAYRQNQTQGKDISSSCNFMVNAVSKGEAVESGEKAWEIESSDLVHTCSEKAVQQSLGARAKRSNFRPADLLPYALAFVKNNIRVTPAAIAAHLAPQFGAVTLPCARSIKRLSLERINSIVRFSFSKLELFTERFQQVDSDNHRVFETVEVPDGRRRFVRTFLGVGAAKRMAPHILPLFHVRMAACKSKFKGFLYMLSGVDNNLEVVDLAFAYAVKESEEHWKWFFQLCKTFLGDAQLNNAVLICNGNSNIAAAIAAELPTCQISRCVRQLVEDLTKQCGQDLASRFWKLANEVSPSLFEVYLSRLPNRLKTLIAEHVPPKELWANSSYPYKRYGICLSPVFDDLMLEILERLPCEMLVGLVQRTNTAIAERVLKSREPEPESGVPDEVERRVKVNEERSKELKVREHVSEQKNEWIAEVGAEDGNEVSLVKLNPATLSAVCSCGWSKVHGIPCMHICAFLLQKGLICGRFVEPQLCWTKYCTSYAAVRATFGIPTEYLNELASARGEVLPPAVYSTNPTKKRRLRTYRSEKKRRCRRCGEMGHYTKTCEARKDMARTGRIP